MSLPRKTRTFSSNFSDYDVSASAAVKRSDSFNALVSLGRDEPAVATGRASDLVLLAVKPRMLEAAAVREISVLRP